MSAAPAAPAVVHGRTLNAHPLFLAQIEAHASQVRVLRARDPEGHTRKNVTRRLAAITKLVFEVIPQDPGRSEYRLRATLGEACKHWFRARLFPQHRLFFRYDASSQVIVCAWVNDEDTRRAYESTDEAYRVSRRMLGAGHPPDSLLDEARAESARLQQPVEGGAG